MTNRNTILKLIVEAFLIFGSIYGAFLLEAKRSMAFERDLLIGKLEKLIEEIDSDSIKLIGTFEVLNDSIYSVNLYEDFKFDSIAVSLLQTQSPVMYDSIWSMLWNPDILFAYDEDVWIESWDNEYSIFRQVMNSSNLFISEQFYYDLKKYRWQREILYNQWINKGNRITAFNAKLDENYTFIVIPEEEIRKQVINEPIFQNTLVQEMHQNKFLIDQSKRVLALIPNAKKKIKDEISAQKIKR